MEDNKLKIHLGSGTIYLRNYLNVDVKTTRTFLAEERPDLVEKYITDESNYYSKQKNQSLERFKLGPVESEYLCDRYGSFFDIPCRDGQAIEILSRQAFEHIAHYDHERVMKEILRVLAPTGVIRIDVPNHEEALEKLASSGDRFYIRHLLGPRNGIYGYHLNSFNRDGLKKLFEDNGFVYDGEEENIHLYPAFTLRFMKWQKYV